MKLRTFLLPLALTCATAALSPAALAFQDASPASPREDTEDHSKLRQDAHEAGQDIKQGAHEAGQEIKEGAHDVGQAVRHGAHRVSAAVRHTAHWRRYHTCTRWEEHHCAHWVRRHHVAT